MSYLFGQMWREEETCNGVFDIVNVTAVSTNHLTFDDLGFQKQRVQIFQHDLVLVYVVWFLCWQRGVAQIGSNLDDCAPVEPLQHGYYEVGLEFLLLQLEFAVFIFERKRILGTITTLDCTPHEVCS